MSTFKVVGLKRFEGSMDGKNIDSGKLFVELALDDTRNGKDMFSKGITVEEIRLQDSEIIKRLEHIPLPFEAHIITKRVSNGTKSREVVLDVRPVEAVKPVQNAPRAA